MVSTHVKTLIFIIGVLLGIVVGYKTTLASEIMVCAFVLTLIQGVLYFLKKRNDRKKVGDRVDTSHVYTFSISLLTLLFSCGLFVGMLRVQFVEERYPYVCDGTCTVTAIIITSPETKNEYQVFVVRPLDVDELAENIQVRAPLYPRYQIGETISLYGKTKTPEVIMPHSDSKVFDYASYLSSKHIGSEMYYPSVTVIDTEAHDIVSYLGRLKEFFVTKIILYVNSPAASLAAGMLFGESSMSKDLVQTFRTAGLSHIIVLSGFNIAIVIAFILGAFVFMPLVIRIMLASISVVLFVFMVGGEASVVRATLMAFVSLLATLVGRKYAAHQALILSLFFIVMYATDTLLYDVSLHLSFLATAGIVYMTPILERRITKIKSKILKEVCVTTLAAYFATLPYIMYTFGTVSVYALLANVLILPFVPLAMLVTFCVVLSSYISNTLALLFGFIDTCIIGGMISIAKIVEWLPLSSFRLTVSFSVMMILYGLVLLICIYMHHKRKDETKVTKVDNILTDIISY